MAERLMFFVGAALYASFVITVIKYKAKRITETPNTETKKQVKLTDPCYN